MASTVPLSIELLRLATKTADFTISADHHGQILRLSPSSDITITLPSAASVAAGFYADFWQETAAGDGIKCLLSGDVDGSGSGGFHLLAGERRRLISDGSAWVSDVLRPYRIAIDFSDTWKQPSGYSYFGGGITGSGGTGAKSGGTGGAGGGGGGACHPFINLVPPAAGSTITFTCAASATGPSVQSHGVGGSASSIAWTGITLYAYGGGGGSWSVTTAGGGGGGGQLSAGQSNTSATTSAYGGSPSPPLAGANAVYANPGYGGASGSGGAASVKSDSAWGGAGGGNSTIANVFPGGNSVFAGPGGGGVDDAGVTQSGGTCAQTGAAGGAGGNAASGGDGTGPGAGSGGTRTGTKAGNSGAGFGNFHGIL